MDITAILIAILVMTLLGAFLAFVLVVANKKFYVYEDPRIDSVEGMLPGVNCGACGQPGCRAFAEEVIDGSVLPAECSVSDIDCREEIADFLGVDAGVGEKKVARLACAGGVNVARQRAQYEGVKTCGAADLVAGGGKGCAWGCLGFGDCEVVCDFNAIYMNEHCLPVVDEEMCTSCGDCVEACPRDLFSIQTIEHRLWVACSSEAKGELAEAECQVACTACERCVMDAPQNIIRMEKNLPVIDYDWNHLTSDRIIQRCPTGAIVWLSDDKRVIKGRKAKKIIRKTPLPIG